MRWAIGIFHEHSERFNASKAQIPQPKSLFLRTYASREPFKCKERKFVVASGDTPGAFDAAEEIFDAMPASLGNSTY